MLRNFRSAFSLEGALTVPSEKLKRTNDENRTQSLVSDGAQNAAPLQSKADGVQFTARTENG
jgi:hypothetical protein